MRTIVVDDNRAYAEALTTHIGDGSEGLLQMNFSTLDEAETELKNRIGEVQDGKNSASSRVLINRELKLDGSRRQEALGEKLYQRVTWEYPEVPFRLYSFRSLETEAPCTRLPFGAGDLPEPPDDEERLKEKERACLAYMDEAFEKVQHRFEKVSPTLVNLVRLINGAIRAGKIRPDGQVGKLLTLFGSLDLDDELEEVVFNFLGCAEQHARLIGQTSGEASADSNSSPRQRQVVVVDDEVSSEGTLEGESLWAIVLEILFEKDGFRFSTCLPSEVQHNPRRLQDNDLVLMDIDFSQDPNYDGTPPEFGGRELLQKVHEVLPHLPVVMVSNYDEGGLYEECMKRGAYGYLTKDWGSYAKFRTDESEEEWFRGWQRAIEVPLNYKPFFQDTHLLRRLGVVSDSGVESLRTALKDIETPTIETTQTLVTFFEEFVNGYLHYRGEVPERSLSDCLENNVFRKKGELPTGQLLRILRNNVVHVPSFMNPEVDTWLYLLLLRAFMLRLLRPASVEDTAWTEVLTDKLATRLDESAACNRERVVCDRSFFENSGGNVSDVNKRFLQKRNEKIDQLAMRRTLNPDELKFHVDGLITCLAAIFPRRDLTKVEDLPALGNRQNVDALVTFLSSQSKSNGRYKRGFESMAPIDWVTNLSLRDALVDFRGEEGGAKQEYEGVLRWALAARCWLWYFDLLLARPNSLMFRSTLEDRKQRTDLQQNSIYEAPDEKLIRLFQGREQLRYLPYYTLRMGLHEISKRIRQQRDDLERQLEDARSKRKTLDEQLQKVKAEAEQERQKKQQKQKQLRKTDARLERLSATPETQSEFDMLNRLEEKREDLEADLATINENIEELEEVEMPPLEKKFKSATDREDTLRVFLQSIRDEESNPNIFPDQVEALERSIRRKMTNLHDFLEVDSFDTNAWIESVHEADSYGEVKRRIEELKAVLP